MSVTMRIEKYLDSLTPEDREEWLEEQARLDGEEELRNLSVVRDRAARALDACLMPVLTSWRLAPYGSIPIGGPNAAPVPQQQPPSVPDDLMPISDLTPAAAPQHLMDAATYLGVRPAEYQTPWFGTDDWYADVTPALFPH